MADSFGTPFGVGATELSRQLAGVLQIDPLSPDLATKLGVDPAGGFAAFSEDINPTFVVHLATPDATHAFFDQLREHGMQSHSMIVEGSEINTAKLADDIDVSWAIDKDWLWVHFAIKIHPEELNAWFVHARHAAYAAWTDNFHWAKEVGDKLASHAPGLVGFFDGGTLRDRLMAAEKLTTEVIGCMKLFQPLGRVAVAVEGSDHHAGGRFAIDLGPAAADIARHVLPPPPGLDAISAGAPLAVQWNLDLDAVLAWFAPCASLTGLQASRAKRVGIRTARAALLTLDPDKPSGTGVIAVDLSSKEFLATKLDDIPHRSTFESNHTYGSHAGRRLSIPFAITLDYVLDDHVGMLAIGDGLLDQLVMGATAATAPIFSIDVHPLGMKQDAWEWLVGNLIDQRHNKAIVDHLMRWKEGHLALSIDHDSLVLEATGNRR